MDFGTTLIGMALIACECVNVCVFAYEINMSNAFVCMYAYSGIFNRHRFTGSNGNSPLAAVEFGSAITQNLITNVTTKRHNIGHKELIRKSRWCVCICGFVLYSGSCKKVEGLGVVVPLIILVHVSSCTAWGNMYRNLRPNVLIAEQMGFNQHDGNNTIRLCLYSEPILVKSKLIKLAKLKKNVLLNCGWPKKSRRC